MNKITGLRKSTAPQYHQHVAVVTEGKIYSYGELDQMVHATENHLREIGVKEKQRIAILSPNCVQYLFILWALWRIGAIACLISPRFPKSTILSLMRQVDCRVILTDDKAMATLKSLSIDKINLPQFMRGLDLMSLDAGLPEGKTFSIPLNREATILFTSGSTATPKAVLHTYANHYYSALGANLNLPLQPADRWLLSLPLCHVSGLAVLFRVFLTGSTVVIPTIGTTIEEAIMSLGVTHVSFVYTQLYRLLSSPVGRRALSKLKGILVGGSAVPEFVMDKSKALKLPLYTTYGSTEMASQVTTTPRNSSLKRLRTSGKTLKYRQLRVAKDHEILVRGKTLFKGYVQGKRLLLPAAHRGWFPTGDLGKFDDDQYLTVWGRKDNMFISGGENIYPEEVEGRLQDIDGVRQAIVVPVKNEEFGYRPVALIKVEWPTKLSRRKIREYLAQHLPRFKIPETIYLWPEQISEYSPKVNRKSLRDFVEENSSQLKELS